MTLARPIARSGKYVFEFGDVSFEVDPRVAGRVTSVKVAGSELLASPSGDHGNYGSTFWTSPQADWGWPPVPEIDSAEFMHSADQVSCTMVGPKTVAVGHPAVDGVSVTKKFTADPARRAMRIDYKIENQSSTPKRLAPWEITRVAAGGLTFYASETPPTGTKMPPTISVDGYTWFRHTATVPIDSKLFADAKGWLAHVTADGRLLVKSFPDVAPGAAADGEAEVEIFSTPSYVELENQGNLVQIDANRSITWTVRWFLRMLPAGVAVSPNNPELIRIVQQTLQ